MEILTAALLPVLFFTLWIYTAWMASSFPSLVNKRILLLIAHPDDEAMFFAPTVQTLSRPELGNQFKILCLSSGNYDGLGELRKDELRKSAAILRLHAEKDVIILDDPKLQDGPESWDPQHIARALIDFLAPTLSKTPSSKAATAIIDVIITFDRHGISSHPNHTSCYHGAIAFLAELLKGRSGWESPVTVYSLTTVGIVRKYIHMLDAVPTIVTSMFRIARQGGGVRKTKSRMKGGNIQSATTPCPNTLLYISGLGDWRRAQKAMVSGHWSQMLWFRWGWIGFGRYLLINDLKKIK